MMGTVLPLRVAPPSRRLAGGRPRPPRRERDALGTAGKMPALLAFHAVIIDAVTVLALCPTNLPCKFAMSS